MIKRLTLIILLIGIVLVSGCVQRDRTEEACTILKNAAEDNTTFKYEGGVCIIEREQQGYTYAINCMSLTERMTLLIKTNVTEDELKLDKHCKVQKLGK